MSSEDQRAEMRKDILFAMDAYESSRTPLMGSMATANLYHLLGLGYGQAGFGDKLAQADDATLHQLHVSVASYLQRVPRPAVCERDQANAHAVDLEQLALLVTNNLDEKIGTSMREAAEFLRKIAKKL